MAPAGEHSGEKPPPTITADSDQYRIPTIGEPPGFSTTSAFLIAIALVVIVMFALMRTRWGFRVKMLGSNAEAARLQASALR